ncbi:MAG: alpha/beta hydrolase [Pseudomonadota bacterium]|nr:alpha/beta hydrolase [Pseudomonadota bacterium]
MINRSATDPSRAAPARAASGPYTATRGRWRVLLTLVVGAVLASGCVMLETKERELTWRPVRSVATWFGGLPQHVQEFKLPLGDDPLAPRMRAWWWPGTAADAPALLYLHGARWNLTGQFRRIEQLHDFGFSVLAIDYRGFGESDGELPSEATVYEDAQAAWKWLARKQPDAHRRYIYGHSLGGAVAVDLASRVAAEGTGGGGLIVESSFTSLADVAAAMSYEWLPMGLILSQKFDSVSKMSQVRMPVLIVHGANDTYVPSRLSETLFAAAPAPKKLVVVQGASHNNSMWVGDAEYRGALSELFGLDLHAASVTHPSAKLPSVRRGG